MTTIIIGSSGSIGTRLVAELARRGERVVAAVRRSALPPSLAASPHVVVEGGVDLRDRASLDRLVSRYASEVRYVWNLAAPLSVETAADPSLAYDVTVDGMHRLLDALSAHGCDRAGRSALAPHAARVLFSDSIGSYGYTAPRDGATARFLVEHPAHDSGSDYGAQKAAIRAALRQWHGDTRFAVIPGVLHSDARFSRGTTEYALDALAHAARGEHYVCPVPIDEQLPMIFDSDLVDALLRLQFAEPHALLEPDAGYAIAGFSFSARQLFSLLDALKSEPRAPFATLSGDIDADAAVARGAPAAAAGAFVAGGVVSLTSALDRSPSSGKRVASGAAGAALRRQRPLDARTAPAPAPHGSRSARYQSTNAADSDTRPLVSPSFSYSMLDSAEQVPPVDGSAAMFARLWPDSLSGDAAERDLGFTARVSMREAVQRILDAHRRRLVAEHDAH